MGAFQIGAFQSGAFQDTSARRGGGGYASPKRVRYLVYRNDAVTLENRPRPPKRLKKRTVSPAIAAKVNALLPRFLGFTPEIVQAALPDTFYIPSTLVGESDNIALALAAYLKRLDDEEEDDIELLLLAA